MTKIILRDYQEKAIQDSRLLLQQKIKKIIIWLNTGAGKGLLMSAMVESAINKGLRVLSVMRRKDLIHQTVKNYFKYHQIDSGILMSNHSKNLDRSSLVSSIDTIRARLENLDFLSMLLS